MAVALDATASSPTQFNSGFTSPQTDSSLTIGGSGTLLLVWVAFGCHTNGNLPTASAITWNGVSMTSLSSKTDLVGLKNLYLFGLVSPATGNHTISVTITGGSFADSSGGIYGLSFSGTTTSSLSAAVPSGNILTDASDIISGSVYPASPFAVTTTSGDAAAAGMNLNNTSWSAMASGTYLATLDNFNANATYGYGLASGTTTNLQFSGATTTNQACGIAVRIVQSSGGGAPVLDVPRRRFLRRHHEPVAIPRRFDAPRQRLIGWTPKLIVPSPPRLIVPARFKTAA